MSSAVQAAVRAWAGLVAPVNVDAAPGGRCVEVPAWLEAIDVDAPPAIAVGPLRLGVPSGAPIVITARLRGR